MTRLLFSTLALIGVSNVFSQNVGIGTTSPVSELHIAGGNQTYTSLNITNNASTHSNYKGLSMGIQYLAGDVSNQFGAMLLYEDFPFHFGTDGMFRMTISNNGRVGIGTKTPASLFHVHSGTGVFSSTSYTNNNTGQESTDGMSVGIQFDAGTTNRYGTVFIKEDAPLFFGTNNSFQAAIRENGNAVFGTIADQGAKLAVKHNSSTSSPTLKLIETGSDYARLELTNDQTARFWHIAGKNQASGIEGDRLNFYLDSLGDILSIRGNGNAVLMGILTQNSDARLKTNIQPLNGSLKSLTELNGYNYQWKNTLLDQQMQIGLLAQEVQKVYPELVVANDNGDLTVNYMGLVPVLIESIKTLQKNLEQQQKEIDLLKAK